MKREWYSVKFRLPPDDSVVHTMICDEKGTRNETKLRFKHNMWFFPDLSMYVYYCPTHWAPCIEGVDEINRIFRLTNP